MDLLGVNGGKNYYTELIQLPTRYSQNYGVSASIRSAPLLAI